MEDEEKKKNDLLVLANRLAPRISDLGLEFQDQIVDALRWAHARIGELEQSLENAAYDWDVMGPEA